MAFPIIKHLEIPEDLKQCGFSAIRITGKSLIVNYNNNNDNNNNEHKPSSLEDEQSDSIVIQYDQKDLAKTEKAIRKKLQEEKSIDSKTVEVFAARLFDLLLKEAEREYAAAKESAEKERNEKEQIIEETQKLREAAGNISLEEWQNGLAERYQTLQNVVQRNMPEIWTGLEFELSVLRILNIEGCTLPFIGILLGRPSSGKTLIIYLLRKWYCAYYTDNFTAKSFVSHSTAVTSEEQLQQIDMLPKIINKLFLTPELSPTFTAKDEDLNQLLGIITRIADGQGLVTNSGAHGQRGYDKNIMFTWVGAAVDIPYKVYKILGNLGAKLYFFRLPFEDKTEEKLLNQCEEDFDTKVKEIQSTLFDYLKWFDIGPNIQIDKSANNLPKIKWDNKSDDKDARRYIARLAILLSRLRCVAQTWKTEDTQASEYGYSVSQPEDPSRANTLLYNLARGHALLTGSGRNYITKEDIPIVIKTVLSTAQIERVSIFDLLLANKGELTTSRITESLNMSKPTALRTMAEFKAIGLVDNIEETIINGNVVLQIILKPEFAWFLSEEFQKLREEFVPMDNKSYLKEGNSKSGSEDGGCKEKFLPYTCNIQEEFFWKIYDKLEEEEEEQQQKSSNHDATTTTTTTMMEIDKNTVSGTELKKRLVSSNKFSVADAVLIIEEMVEAGKLEKVSFDTYRRRRIVTTTTTTTKDNPIYSKTEGNHSDTGP
jgi:hypothetical protein